MERSLPWLFDDKDLEQVRKLGLTYVNYSISEPVEDVGGENEEDIGGVDNDEVDKVDKDEIDELNEGDEADDATYNTGSDDGSEEEDSGDAVV